MTLVPEVLYDPVPGNIGLLGIDRRPQSSSTVLLLHFAEPDGVLLVDDQGNLNDLGIAPGVTMPSSVTTWTGLGRQFTAAASNALIAEDQDGSKGTLLMRDCTVQALLALDLAGDTGIPQTIICRGTNDGSNDELVSMGLELVGHDDGSGFVDVRWTWREPDGTLITAPAGTFATPGDGKWFLLTATRRWESSTSVVLRYYVDQRMIGEYSTASGNVAGSTVAHTTVGGRLSATVWDHFLNATLDDLALCDFEMSIEEIREVWRRLSVHQPAGVDMFVSLIPPGAPWYADPGNQVGRWMKLIGQNLGVAIANIERLRALGLPDWATLELAERYEAMCKLAPGPRDSLDTRRARIVGHLSQDEGFALSAIQTALAPLLQLQPAQVEIVEFTNDVIDGFDAAIAAERWLEGPTGAWSVVAGELALAVGAGADLGAIDWTQPWCHLRTPLSGTDGLLAVQCKLSTYAAGLPINTMIGGFLCNRRSGNAVWFGIGDVAGVRHLGYRLRVANVIGAFVPLAASPDAPVWVRFASVIGAAAGTYAMAWSITGANVGYTFGPSVATGILDLEWAGFGALNTTAVTATNLAVTFDDFLLHDPHGDRTFCWYAYRDPGLAGALDTSGARGLIRRIKPAHTWADVVTSLSVLCDDARDGLPDRGPLGAL